MLSCLVYIASHPSPFFPFPNLPAVSPPHYPPKSFPLNLFADPHPLTPVASIFYKNIAGRGASTLQSPSLVSYPRSANFFICHTSKKSLPKSNHCHTSKIAVCNPCICHTSEPRGARPRTKLFAPHSRRFPYPLSFHILPHSFALSKSSTLLFSIDSELFAKNTRGGGTPCRFGKLLENRPNPMDRILVSLDRTHAPPPDSYRSDFIALPAAPGGRGRMALRPCISPSHPPRAHARSHP